MTDRDNITLPRKVVEKAAESLEWAGCGAGGGDCYEEAAKALRTALAAPRLEVTVDPRLTAEEAAAISAAIDARKKEQSEEAEALRRDAERYRWLQDAGQKYWMEFADMTAEATEAAIDAAMQEDKR